METRAKGPSLAEHLESVERQTGKHDPRLDAPILEIVATGEQYAAAVIGCFYEASAGRQSGFSGPAPLSWTDIKNWCELNELVLTPWEVQMIKLLDLVYIAEVDELLRKEQ